MPLTVITEEQQRNGVTSLEPEFLALLEAKQVPIEVRGLLGHLGVTRLTTYAHLEAEETRVRDMLRADLGLDSADGMQSRIIIASMVEAWKTARQRVRVADEAAAEARAQERPRELMAPQAHSLRRSHALVYGELEDEEWPGRDYLAWRFAQFEEGEYRAETLAEVVNMVDAGDDGADPAFHMLLSSTGKVATVRNRVRVDPPRTPEQLRRCYRLMGTHWEVMRQVYPDRSIVSHFSAEIFHQLVSHLLGPKVAEYRSRGGVSISWAGLMEYEFRIRKHALALVTKQGMDLMAALRTAWKDPTLENRYFTLELVTSGERAGGNSGGAPKGGGKTATKRALERELAEVKKLRAQLAQEVKSGPNTGGQAASSSGGGGTPKAGKSNRRLKDITDLKKKEQLTTKARGSTVPICQFFNLGDCNRGASCKFDHLCLRCHQAGHGIFDCPATPRPKGAQ